MQVRYRPPRSSCIVSSDRLEKPGIETGPETSPEVIKLFSCLTQLSLKFLLEKPGIETGPEVIILFSCSTQLSLKFLLLINT